MRCFAFIDWKGSLDAEIQRESARANNFATFFRHHPKIKLVCFNGAIAEYWYKKQVLPLVPNDILAYKRQPSTNQALTLAFEKKYAAWAQAIQGAYPIDGAYRNGQNGR